MQNEARQNMAAYKEQLFAQFGRLGRALASPRRLELLDLLCQAERTVEDLCRETGLTASNVSQHLSILRDTHLVASRKEGLHVYYRLADPLVSDFWHYFRTVAVRCLAEAREVVQAYHQQSPDLEPIDLVQLRRRVAAGDVVVLDVRPEVEYEAGHLPGALSIPLPQLEARLAEIPAGSEVIAYCRGPYCVMAHEAVRILRREGMRAVPVEQGVEQWRAQGLPVEVGSEHGSQTNNV